MITKRLFLVLGTTGPALALVWACSDGDHSLGKGLSESQGNEDGGAVGPSTGGARNGTGGESTSSTGGASSGNGGASPGTGGATGTPGTCAAIEAEAEALWRANRQCTEDTDCRLLETGASCVPSILCQHAFNLEADVDALREAASDLADRYAAENCSCTVTRCIEPPGAYCNSTTGLCDSLPVTCGQPYHDQWDVLVNEYNHCEEDADCGHVFVEGADCVTGCGPILNVTLDLSEIHEEGPRLSQEMVAACESCAVPGCLPPTGFRCNAQSRCEAVYATD